MKVLILIAILFSLGIVPITGSHTVWSGRTLGQLGDWAYKAIPRDPTVDCSYWYSDVSDKVARNQALLFCKKECQAGRCYTIKYRLDNDKLYLEEE